MLPTLTALKVYPPLFSVVSKKPGETWQRRHEPDGDDRDGDGNLAPAGVSIVVNGELVIESFVDELDGELCPEERGFQFLASSYVVKTTYGSVEAASQVMVTGC